jgi:isovaleryl-CoA dehydrogenase
MQAAMDLTLEYTHERYQFGKPIATMQLMQGKLAGKHKILQIGQARARIS